MMAFQLAAILFRDISAWYVLLCLFLALAYAWLFYQPQLKKDKWVYILFALRLLTVFFLSFLLLSPLVKSIHTRIEKPLILMAHDVSASVALSSGKDFRPQDFNSRIDQLVNSLQKDYEVVQLQFGDHVRKGKPSAYADKYTDMSQLVQYISQQYQGRNIGALILPSDGIINHGEQNALRSGNLRMPVYSIALGDTIPQKDLVLSNVNYNQWVHLKDQHEIEISLSAYALKGSQAALFVRTSDGQTQQHTLTINSEEWNQKVRVKLDARKKGWQKVTVSAKPIENEISYENNQQTVYVEVIEGRQQVLLLADAPHPDLSAIKQALEQQNNYKVEVSYADAQPNDFSPYGLFILHNIPSARSQNWKGLLQKIGARPAWFILGNQTSAERWNEAMPSMSVVASVAGQGSLPQVDPSFSSFSLSPETKEFLQQYAPPLSSSVRLKGGASNVMLSVKSAKQALLTFYSRNDANSAILFGEGLWRWRMENYKHQQQSHQFEELIAKTAQYLTTKADRRKFRAYVVQTRFADSEPVLLNAELYNDLYEPVSGEDISVELNNGQQKFSFVFSPKDRFYEVNAGLLPAGEYDFIAKTNYGGKLQQVKGKFVVEKTNAELLYTSADHQFLYNLSDLSGGKMLYPENMNELPSLIKANEKITSLAFEDESYQDILHLWWVFVALILLLTAEWFLRKRNGMV